MSTFNLSLYTGVTGSGKTAKLIEAVASAMDNGCEAHSILLLSGSMDGAKTLYQRILQSNGDVARPMAYFSLSEWCLVVLRTYYAQHSLDPFSVFNDRDMSWITAVLGDDSDVQENWLELNNGVKSSELPSIVLSLIQKDKQLLRLFHYGLVVVDNMHWFSDSEKQLIYELAHHYNLTLTSDSFFEFPVLNNVSCQTLSPRHTPSWISFKTSHLDQEALFITQHIQQARDEGVDFSEMVVITAAHSHELEKQLVASRIPYTKVGEYRFFETPELRRVLSYLKAVFNPNDVGAVLDVAQSLGIAEEDSSQWVKAVLDTRKPLPSLVRDLSANIPQREALKDLFDHIYALQADYAEHRCTLENLILSIADLALQTDLDGIQEGDDDLNPEERLSELLNWVQDEQFSLVTLLDAVAVQTPWQRTLRYSNRVLLLPLQHMSLLDDLAADILFISTPQDADASLQNLFSFILNKPTSKTFISGVTVPSWMDSMFEQGRSEDPQHIDQKAWACGDTVQHPEWGIGKISAITGEKDRTVLELDFGEFTKKVMSKYASLKRIS